MISESINYYAKVTEYFEALTLAMDYDNYAKVGSLIARLSRHTYMFDGNQQDAYDEAVEWLEINEPWDEEYQPDEAQEWYDFDPDC